MEPYYSEVEQAERMTKCSFVCMLRRNEDKKGYELSMKEVTYTSPDLSESCVAFECRIGDDKAE